VKAGIIGFLEDGLGEMAVERDAKVRPQRKAGT